MLLNSYSFLLIFLPLVVVLYWLVPRGYPRLVFLIVASLVFYGLWEWRYVPLLLATTLTDWIAGRYLAKTEAEGASRAASSSWRRPSRSTSPSWATSNTAASSWTRSTGSSRQSARAGR